ncbi:MAG: phosphoenolpyruvate--protein phosphotransferase [Spirochaetales bacterium]|nr:phosphoenolpyruvate--protein phosphotransferase [Spirochaetales bacterium]
MKKHVSSELKNKSLDLVFRINEYINQNQDIKIILNGIIKIIKDFYLFDVLILYLWDSGTKKLIPDNSSEGDYQKEFNPGEGLAGTVFHNKEIITSQNVVSHIKYKEVINASGKEYLNYLGIPILLQSNCMGVMEIWNGKEKPISETQIEIVRIVCSRISGLLEVREILDKFDPSKSEGESASHYGFPLSKGIAMGNSFIIPEMMQNEYIEMDVSTDIDVEGEKERLAKGFSRAIQEMEILIKNIKNKKRLSESDINIFKVHLLILQDETFLDDVKQMIDSKKLKAEVCLSEYIENKAQKLKQMDDSYFRDRAYDFLDIGHRIILMMQSQDPIGNLFLSLPDNSIIIAEYISPAILVSLEKSKIKGIVIEKGGRSSHTAILAQALNIPAVSELEGINHLIPPDTSVLVDGNHGIVIVNPEEKTIINYQNDIKKEEYIRTVFEHKIRGQIRNRQKINIAANISFMHDIKWTRKYGIPSVGLFRSEFFFMRFNSWPSVKDQMAVYKELAESFPGGVTIRLLDVGADKKLPYIQHKREENPLLGLRSVRFLLKNPDLLYSQLFALMSVFSMHSNIRILLPMVTTCEEMELVKSKIQKIRGELKLKSTPDLGAMIEVPSILYQIKDMAKVADFFSIGTNDLVQYLLAVDRESITVGDLYSGFQPPVVNMLYRLNRELVKTGKNVNVCGELSGNPSGALCLIALGYSSLSIYPARAPIIKYLCSLLDKTLLTRVQEKILKLKDKASIQRFLMETLIDLDPIFAEIE